MVRKIGTNKTQVLDHMRMRQITTCQPLPNIWITIQNWKPDPELSLKHDELYGRAWECDCEKPSFDAENDNVAPPNSPEIAL